MCAFIAVFNGHVNDAFGRTKRSYLSAFGRASWDKHIGPHEKGIMAIFEAEQTPEREWYILKVQEIVNENALKAVEKP